MPQVVQYLPRQTPASHRWRSRERRAVRPSPMRRPSPTSRLPNSIRRSMEANSALMRGDIDRYRALITLTDDFTLMSPFGGTPTHGSDMTSERWEAMGRFFRNGTFAQEVVRSLRDSRHGGPCDHRALPRRGRRSAGPGLGAARHAGLLPRRLRMAVGASACRSARCRRKPGTGGGARSGRCTHFSPRFCRSVGTPVNAATALAAASRHYVSPLCHRCIPMVFWRR